MISAATRIRRWMNQCSTRCSRSPPTRPAWNGSASTWTRRRTSHTSVPTIPSPGCSGGRSGCGIMSRRGPRFLGPDPRLQTAADPLDVQEKPPPAGVSGHGVIRVVASGPVAVRSNKADVEKLPGPASRGGNHCHGRAETSRTSVTARKGLEATDGVGAILQRQRNSRKPLAAPRPPAPAVKRAARRAAPVASVWSPCGPSGWRRRGKSATWRYSWSASNSARWCYARR